MKNTIAIAAVASLSLAATASAQSAQEQLDARYNRALAAGYKAMMLCSALSSSERLGGSRSEESIHEWELTGIYPVMDPIIRDLPFEVVRYSVEEMAKPPVYQVRVTWADDMPARSATQSVNGGCFADPIGAPIEDAPPITLDAAQDNVVADGWSVNENAIAKADKQRLSRQALDGTYGKGSRTTAALVIQGDEIVMEHYAQGFGPDTPQRTWSVAKSIASTLVGMGLHAEQMDVNEPIGINYWRGNGIYDLRNTITINHALRMATGRYSDTPGNRTDPLYWGGASVNEAALHWPVVHKPGTVFRYANNDTLLAAKAVEQFLDYYEPDKLLQRINMHRTLVESDSSGGYVLSSQVWTTARDLGRLGQLHLKDGMWDGERLLPEGWVEYISDPSGPQPEGRKWGYGAGWWTFRRPEGVLFDGVPEDGFAARGNRGQYVVIIPSRDLVIVRRGEDPVGSRFNIIAFTRDILASLED